MMTYCTTHQHVLFSFVSVLLLLLLAKTPQILHHIRHFRASKGHPNLCYLTIFYDALSFRIDGMACS